MKKLSSFTYALLILTFSFNVSIGQSSYDDLISIASLDFAKVDRPPTVIIKNKKNSVDPKNKIKGNEIFYDISDVEMSTTIDLKSNTLDFSGEDNNRYSKIQLTHKHTKKTIISREINSDFKIDLNKILPGTYFLILSNAKGEIKSEEITIL